MAHSVAFFVCGTPSNNDGFQLVELGPAKLPGSARGYLDRPASDTAESYRFEPVLVDGRRYLLYGRALRINTYDSAANRGAYLAVGCLVGTMLPMHVVANCIDIVSEIYGNVTGLLDADRRFAPGYRLSQYVYSGVPLDERLEHQCSPLLLADLIMQGLGAEGAVEWQQGKPLSFSPAELLAADVRRYQRYTTEGALGSLLSLDERRAEIEATMRQTVAAAGLANELHTEWQSFRQSLDEGVARLAAKASAFRAFTGDMERVAERSSRLGSASASAAQIADDGPDLAQRDGREWPAREQALVRGGSRRPMRRRTSRGAEQRIFGMRPGWVAYTVAGVAAAVLLTFAVRQWLGDNVPSTAERNALGTPAEVLPPSASTSTEDGAHAPPEPRRPDVASERAALDAPVPDEPRPRTEPLH
jgi:hypothetical protein